MTFPSVLTAVWWCTVLSYLACLSHGQIDCSKTDQPFLCTEVFCRNNSDVELTAALCPHICGFCDARGLDCSVPDTQSVCHGNFCEVFDLDLRKGLCPHLCGFCDAGGNACVDYVVDGVACSDLGNNICNDEYGRDLCPRFCNVCGNTTPSPAATTTQSDDTCDDHVGNGLRCSHLPGVCSNTFGQRLCPRHCKLCDTTDPEEPTEDTLPPGTCTDHVESERFQCGTLDGICADEFGQIFCPRHCGTCGNATTTTTTTTTTSTSTTTASTSPPPVECTDHLLHGKVCNDTAGMCDNLFGHLVCKRTCETCTGPTPQDQPELEAPVRPDACVDYVGYGLTCQELPGICSDHFGIGPTLCPMFCGICQPPSDTDCKDHVGGGLQCRDFDNICNKSYTARLCPEHCQLCTTPADTTLPSTSATPSTTPSATPSTTPSATPSTTPSATPSTTPSATPSTTPSDTTLAQPDTTTTISPLTSPNTDAGSTATSPSTDASSAATSPSTNAGSSAASPSTDVSSPVTSPSTDVGSSVTTAEPCEDRLTPPHDCAQLEITFTTLCQDPNGYRTCPRYCGFCIPEPTTTTSCVPRNNSNCVDYADSEVCNIPHFCEDQFAPKACAKTCEFCTPSCEDSIPTEDKSETCDDLYGRGKLLATKEELCNDELGKVICQRTCDCPGYCPE